MPQGWRDATEAIGDSSADSFSPRTQDVVVLVLAEQVQPGTDTLDYAEERRDREESIGYFPSDPVSVRLGGSRALAWEVTGTSEDGSSIRQRTVATVRDTVGWLVVFAGDEMSYGEAAPSFEEMLRSWAWK